MNNTFSINRFGLLLKKHYFENIRQYLMSPIVLIGVLIASFSYVIFVNDGGHPTVQNQFGVFLTFFILGGSIFTANIFSNFSEKRKAIAGLTLPASHFEKYLLGWLFTAILFPVVYTSLFYIVDIAVLRSFSGSHYTPRTINVFSKEYRIVFLFYALFQSISLCGAIYFRKLHFIKTAFLFFLLVFGLLTLNTWMMGSLIPEKVRTTMFFDGVGFVQKGYHYYQIKPAHPETYFNLCMALLTVAFWLSAYFKIKEKQV